MSRQMQVLKQGRLVLDRRDAQGVRYRRIPTLRRKLRLSLLR
jgi:hypothetical protein